MYHCRKRALVALFNLSREAPLYKARHLKKHWLSLYTFFLIVVSIFPQNENSVNVSNMTWNWSSSIGFLAETRQGIFVSDRGTCLSQEQIPTAILYQGGYEQYRAMAEFRLSVVVAGIEDSKFVCFPMSKYEMVGVSLKFKAC